MKTFTIREIVTNDYRTADVFRKWGINYCCNGNVSLREACLSQNVNEEMVLAEIQNAKKSISISNSLSFVEWPLDFLADYIFYVHHDYIKKAAPLLREQLEHFSSTHKNKFGYLAEVLATFETLSTELVQTLKYEEEVIFPYIKQVNNTYQRQEVYGALFVKTLRKPLRDVLEHEHNRIMSLLTHLREVTANYTTAADNICTNHSVLYHKLSEFDADLVQHKHLENNILFPKAIKMESELLQLSNIR